MSLFYRKAFMQIAELLRETNADDVVVDAFVDLFSDDNHRFVEDKFRAAVTKDNEGY